MFCRLAVALRRFAAEAGYEANRFAGRSGKKTDEGGSKQIRQKDYRRQGQADQAKRLPKAGANESCKMTAESGQIKSGGRTGGAAVMLRGQDNVDKKVKAL